MHNQKQTYGNFNFDDSEKYYDFCLLSGMFKEIESAPLDEISQLITSAEQIFSSSKTLKGNEKLFSFAESLFMYTNALSLQSRCRINDKKALFSFICIRYPQLELDWSALLRIVIFAENKKIPIEEQGMLEAAIRIYISSIKEELNRKELKN
jgi:hypothetical protein